MAPDIGAEALRAEHVAKSFGRIAALKDINLRLCRGEVLGLLGDNGAGKSTLMKILTGYHQPSAGQLYFEGQPVHFRSVAHARSLGIEVVFQDLALVNQLNVYRNMFLQREPVFGGPLGILDERRMRDRAIEVLERMRVRVPSVASTSTSPSCRADSGRPSRSRVRSTRRRRCCCSMSPPPRWARRNRR